MGENAMMNRYQMSKISRWTSKQRYLFLFWSFWRMLTRGTYGVLIHCQFALLWSLPLLIIIDQSITKLFNRHHEPSLTNLYNQPLPLCSNHSSLTNGDDHHLALVNLLDSDPWGGPAVSCVSTHCNGRTQAAPVPPSHRRTPDCRETPRCFQCPEPRRVPGPRRSPNIWGARLILDAN